MRRALAILFMMMGAISFSQGPEFIQQYRQRVGGALDEINRLMAEFDRDIAIHGLTREQALSTFQTSAIPFLIQRGASMRATFDRQNLLIDHKRQLDRPDLIHNALEIIYIHDKNMLLNTVKDYRVAIPLSAQGIVISAAGAALGWMIGQILGWLFLWPFRNTRPAR